MCAYDGTGEDGDVCVKTVFFLYHRGKESGIVLAVRMADEDGTLRFIGHQLVELICESLDGGTSAAYLEFVDQVSLEIYVEDGLDAENAADEGNGGAYPYAVRQTSLCNHNIAVYLLSSAYGVDLAGGVVFGDIAADRVSLLLG